MTGVNKRRTIANWLLQGLPYRTWTAREMTWVLYEELVTALYEARAFDDLRSFLKTANDTSRLGALDREIMGQRNGVEVQDTPRLRGRG